MKRSRALVESKSSRPDPVVKRLRRELQRVNRADMVASAALLARELLLHRPRRAAAWLHLGDNLGSMAHYQESELALRRALRLVLPEHRDMVLGRIGQLFAAQHDAHAAVRWFRRAVTSNPSEAAWHVFLGCTLARLGRLQAAAECHRRATRCRTGCIDEAWLNLGLIRRAQGRYQDAARCFRKAIALDPRYREAKVALRDVEYALTIRARLNAADTARSPRSRQKR